jgi:hypothetical protein
VFVALVVLDGNGWNRTDSTGLVWVGGSIVGGILPSFMLLEFIMLALHCIAISTDLIGSLSFTDSEYSFPARLYSSDFTVAFIRELRIGIDSTMTLST